MAFNVSYRIQVLNGFSRNIKKLKKGLTGLRTKMKEMEKAGVNSFKKIGAASKRMSAGFARVGVAAAAFVGLAGREIYTFTQAMNGVQAKAGFTTAEMVLLNAEARRLGATTEKSATQAAQGMEILAAAGLNTKQILELIPNVLALSTVGDLSLPEAAKNITKVLDGFGLEVSQGARVADVLTKVANSVNTNVGEMGFALRKVAAQASLASLSLEKTAAILGILIGVGNPGDVAGTGLKAILISLKGRLKPPQLAGLKDIGLTAKGFLAARKEGTSQMFAFLAAGADKIREKFLKTMSPDDALKASKDQISLAVTGLVGRRFGSLLAPIMLNWTRVIKLDEKLMNAKGAAKEAQLLLLQGIVGAFTTLKSVFGELQLSLGDAGLTANLIAIANGLRGMLESFNKLPFWVRKFIGELLLFAVVLAPILTVFAAIASAVGLIVLGLGAFGIGAVAASGYLAAFVAAVAAITYILLKVVKHWDAIIDGLKTILKKINDLIPDSPVPKNIISNMIGVPQAQLTGSRALHLGGLGPAKIDPDKINVIAKANSENIGKAAPNTNKEPDTIDITLNAKVENGMVTVTGVDLKAADRFQLKNRGLNPAANQLPQ